jgi:hypothetical protein
MKGTLISILVGALAGVLLTVGSALHTSRAAVAHAAQVPAPTLPAQATTDAPSGDATTATPEATPK